MNLSWCARGAGRLGSPSPGCLSTTHSSLPDSDKHPLREYRNQEPASRGLRGVWKGAGRGRGNGLNNIDPEDLRETPRLYVLHQKACEVGLASPGDAGRLAFVALAEHAKAYATRSPCGLFAWLLRRQAWAFVTSADEDRARKRLRILGEGAHRVSDDGALVQGLVAELASRLGGANVATPYDSQYPQRPYVTPRSGIGRRHKGEPHAFQS